MKLTSDRCFADTNIVLYAHTDLDIRKQLIAQNLLSNNLFFLSTQVVQETMNVLSRKMKLKWHDIENVAIELMQNNSLHINKESTLTSAAKIAAKYQFSFYDSLIISAALETGCSVLYSEDLNADQVIDGKLRIVNPFK